MNNIATRKLNHFVVISVGVFVVLVVLMLGMLKPNGEYVFQPLSENANLELDASYQEFTLFHEIAIPAGVY